MSLRNNKFWMSLLALAFTASCANKPPQYQKISSSANATTEIERTEEMINQAKDRQVDVLSPGRYTDARKALDKAKAKKDSGKSNEDVLEQVAYARGWLSEANAKAAIAETSMKDIADARGGALKAGANKLFPSEWSKAGSDLERITSAIEQGIITPAENKGDDLTTRYRELEIKSVTKSNLGLADENLMNAKKDGADKKAPRSYSSAMMKYQNAEKIIRTNPRNADVIRRASEDATKESMHLADVMKKVSAGNTEELVLMTERQQRTISNLRSEYSSTEQELQQSQQQLTEAEREKQELARKQAELERLQSLNMKAAKLRSQFKPNEAEVFTENGKLMVRLKGLQFPTNKASIGPRNEALLQKVETALGEVGPSRLRVEGHSDSTGNPEKNIILSEQRAKAVQDFLVSKGVVDSNRVESIGVGSEKPISDNNTSRGRAENRRIDLVIETE